MHASAAMSVQPYIFFLISQGRRMPLSSVYAAMTLPVMTIFWKLSSTLRSDLSSCLKHNARRTFNCSADISIYGCKFLYLLYSSKQNFPYSCILSYALGSALLGNV